MNFKTTMSFFNIYITAFRTHGKSVNNNENLIDTCRNSNDFFFKQIV